MTLKSENLRIVCKLEKSLLDPRTRRSANELNELIGHNFVEIGSSGKRYDKNSTIKTLLATPNRDLIEITDLRAMHLSLDTVLVTYKTEKETVVRSSVWQYIDQKWVIIFHQASKTLIHSV